MGRFEVPTEECLIVVVSKSAPSIIWKVCSFWGGVVASSVVLLVVGSLPSIGFVVDGFRLRLGILLVLFGGVVGLIVLEYLFVVAAVGSFVCGLVAVVFCA